KIFGTERSIIRDYRLSAQAPSIGRTGLAQLVDRDSLYARAGNGRARVNKPFRIDNLSVFLNFVHQAALMIWNERRQRELPLLGDSASNLFRDRFAILGR